jgi:hypothetical protein
LANQRQTAGLADVNALATLGQQQQAIEQNRALMPLDVLNKRASLMSGVQLPMTTNTTMTGSPLSAIAGLGTTAIGLFSKPIVGRNTDGTPIYGTPVWDTLSSAAKDVYNKMGITANSVKEWLQTQSTPTATTDPNAAGYDPYKDPNSATYWDQFNFED